LTLFLLLTALLTSATPTRPFTIVFVGDVMLGRDVATALEGDWPAAFAGVRPWLAEADLAFANLESPLTTAPYAGGRFDLRAPPEAIAALTFAGFDFVSLANNHALDGGTAGLLETIATLDRAGILAIVDSGIRVFGDSEVERFPTAEIPNLRITNLRIAVLAFSDTGQPLDTTTVARAAAETDLVMVSMHWGAEYYPVTERQRALSQELVAAGADLIIGHGPHVLQPVEGIDGALVAFSLGNFLFDQPFPDTRQGAILRITVDRGSITAVEAVPTFVRRGCVRPAIAAGEEEAAAVLSKLRIVDQSRD
jgi:poly-gamma-glutamate synthesis protein (capsule biosynthesis protein)